MGKSERVAGLVDGDGEQGVVGKGNAGTGPERERDDRTG